MEHMSKATMKLYAAAIALPVAVGILSSLLTRGNMDIYDSLQTPPLSPPAVLFPIVWTALYILMGISSALVRKNRASAPQAAAAGLKAYGISLFFNFFWSLFFFNFRWLFFSFLWLMALLYLILRTIRFYQDVSPSAAYLQIPYALWVTFAGYLNAGIWALNR